MINEQEYNNLKRDFEDLKREFYRTKFGGSTIITGSTRLSELILADGGNLAVGTSVGSKIGSASTQKLAFWGQTPAVRPATISDPAGGLTVDAEARTAINTLIDRLQAIGLIA